MPADSIARVARRSLPYSFAQTVAKSGSVLRDDQSIPRQASERPVLLDFAVSQAKDAFLKSETAKTTNFITKLWNYLIDNPCCPCIYWHQTGRYLIIPNEEKLVEQVVLNLYKQASYSSFARQLNIYGFKRINLSQSRDTQLIGVPEGARIWRHEFLVQDSPMSALATIRRHATSKKPSKNTISARDVPIRPNSVPASPTRFMNLVMPESISQFEAVSQQDLFQSPSPPSPAAHYAYQNIDELEMPYILYPPSSRQREQFLVTSTSRASSASSSAPPLGFRPLSCDPCLSPGDALCEDHNSC